MFTILKRVTALLHYCHFSLSNSDESNSKEDPSGGFERPGMGIWAERKKRHSFPSIFAPMANLFWCRVELVINLILKEKKAPIGRNDNR